MSFGPARSGYTLMEVLVVVAIIAILTGVGFAAYTRFDRVRKVEQAALSFGMYLREVQKMADAGQRPSDCLGNLSGFQVLAATPNDFSQLITYCSAALTPISKPLANATIFADDFNITFQTIGQGVLIPAPQAENGETNITDNAGSTKYKITVTPGGAITVERN